MTLNSPFSRPTFMGASLISFSSSLGWNDQRSQLNLRLVEDPENFDLFLPPEVGTPVYFDFYGFSFTGLLQRWVRKSGPDGFTIEVNCTDARDLLEATQVIVRDYNGSTSAVANLLNAYGFQENAGGFGASLVNDSGMPWYLILDAVTQMTQNKDGTDYGGPITFKGVSYSVDLSALPTPPQYYRIGASDNLLTMISQVCADGGCDFFVELVDFTIVVRTVNRYSQPPLGTITALVNADTGDLLMDSEAGLESRNEVTSSFLVGGERADIFIADNTNTTQFWGFDPLGNPLTGTPNQTMWLPKWNAPSVNPNQSPPAPPGYLFPGTYTSAPPTPPPPIYSDSQPDNSGLIGGGYWTFEPIDPNRPIYQLWVYGYFSWYAGATGIETMNLNATEVAYIIGGTLYPCSTLEMRCALTNQETWEAFIWACRPDVAKILGVVASPFNNSGVKSVLQTPGDLVNDEPSYAQYIAQYSVADEPLLRQTALWQFVAKCANQFLGRTYLVGIPFVLEKREPDTLQVVFSQQPTDAGYLPQDQGNLGIADYNVNFFLTEDERMQGFAFYDTSAPLDLLRLQPQDCVLQNNGVYLKCQAAFQGDIFLTPTPAVIIELPTPVFAVSTDFVGDLTALAAILQTTPDELQGCMQDIVGGALNLILAPAVLAPTNIAIPMKSNVLTYGPWYVSGPAGKVLYEFDNSLTPWNYGGFDQMNDAGMARVVNAVTFMQKGESGRVDKAEVPLCGLGGILEAGGPEVTNINVSCGQNGVTTQYEFRTWSPRFGIIPKQVMDRVQRLGQTGMKLRRALRTIGRNLWQFAIAGTVGKAGAAYNESLQGTLKVARPQTPHLGIAMRTFTDGNALDGSVRCVGSTMTAEELVRAARADNTGLFQTTGLMSLTGLLRPFSTSSAAAGIACFNPAPSGYNYANAMTTQSHNPFMAGHDVEWIGWGSGYSGLNTYRQTPDATNTRAIALRAPLVLSGWGWGIDANPVPGSNGAYVSNVLHRSDLWKTGVLDTYWDDARGVWTVHDALAVVIPAGTTFPGLVNVMDPVTGQDTGQRLMAYNWFNGSIDTSAGDLKAIINFIVTASRWYVVATDCPS